MTRTVADTALLMRVISRPDARDWTSLPPEDIDWLDLDRHGVRAAGRAAPRRRLRGTGRAGGSPRSYRAAAGLFREAGACVEPVAAFAEQELLDASTSSGGCGRGATTTDCRWRRSGGCCPTSSSGATMAPTCSGAQLLECYQQITQMQSRTVAATPAVRPGALPGGTGPRVPGRAADALPGARARACRTSGSPRRTTCPASRPATVNAGFTDDGRPVGVQVSGRRFDDLGVLRAAPGTSGNRPPRPAPLAR